MDQHEHSPELQAMLQAAGEEAASQMLNDPTMRSVEALEDISEALAEVYEFDGVEKIYTVISELRGIRQHLGELVEIAKAL